MQCLLQALLFGCTLVLAFWAELPAAAWAGFGLAGLATIFANLASPSVRARGEGAVLAALWIGSLTVWVSMARADITWNPYHPVMAGLMAAAVWFPPRRREGAIWCARRNGVVMAWLLWGALTWLGAGYARNQCGDFYGGLAATVMALVLSRCWFRVGAAGAQAVNTLILLLVGLPLVDLALRPQSRIAVRPETSRLYYSFDAAKGDPESFARWEEYYAAQFDRLGVDIFTPYPIAITPPHSTPSFKLRPGSRGMMMNCPISINRLGFRGPEIAAAKGDVYRIVALGESSTFGMTIEPGDKPWPEVLGQIIRQRLKTRRPVQVINAGVPAYSIWANLDRLPRDILPLHPDMIISYHGANGFSMIDNSVPPALGPAPPVYQERPIKLAAEAEFRWRRLLFQRRARRGAAADAPPAAPPLKTSYADAYRQLIQCARTNGIRLALANFSMAVNQASDTKVMDFYMGGGAPKAYGFCRANAVHSVIVQQLAAENPEVCFVDTHPHLDGEHEKFIDLVHFTGEGDRQLAENIFTGIRPVLQKDLAPP